jgi:hypothetical protein
LGGLAFGQILPVLKPELAAAVQSVTIAASVGLGVACGVAGGLSGSYLDKVEDEQKFARQHPRSCINCKFVLWDEATGQHDCFYRVEKMFQIMFKPGRKFDTYTDCPSYDAALPDEKIKVQRRDTIGKD